MNKCNGVCVRVRACVHVRDGVCVCVCVHVHACVCVTVYVLHSNQKPRCLQVCWKAFVFFSRVHLILWGEGRLIVCVGGGEGGGSQE